MLRPFQDYFSSYETGQSVGGAKTGEPRETALLTARPRGPPFSLFVSPVTIMLRKQKLIIFIGECKNQEMLLCIKYLNRKGIEVRDGSSHKCFSLVDF